MKFYTNKQNKPLLLQNQTLINLNTLEVEEIESIVPVKAGKDIKISKHSNDKFLEKAGKFFKISRITKYHGQGWYKLENQIVLFCVIQGDSVQVVGNYPIHYLKLLYRYINSL